MDPEVDVKRGPHLWALSAAGYSPTGSDLHSGRPQEGCSPGIGFPTAQMAKGKRKEPCAF